MLVLEQVLLAGFFHYYSLQFDHAKHVASVRCGSVLQKSEYAPTASSSRSAWRIAIEDPFERNRDLGSVLWSRDGQRALAHSWQTAHEVSICTRILG